MSSIPDDHVQHLRLLEAILFASAEPVDQGALQERFGKDVDVVGLLQELADLYAHRGVNLVAAGGRWAFRTAADLGPLLRSETEVQTKLSRAAIETLAIIAYHQPVTRAEIEEIRGASLSQATLDALLEMGLIATRGRKEVPGRPALWATTPRFLEQFGLKSLADLPRREELVNDPTLPLAPPPA